MTTTDNLTLRQVDAAHPAVLRLAALDESRPPDGPVLLAEVDGLPWAAVGLRDGHLVATPFQPSAGVLPVLRARADQLRGAPTRAGRLRELAAMAGLGAWRSAVRDERR